MMVRRAARCQSIRQLYARKAERELPGVGAVSSDGTELNVAQNDLPR